MQPDVAYDFEFGRQFLSELKMIAGLHLLGEAPFEEDAQRATDLIVLRLDAVRIACRVRRHEYLERYEGEFTIRSSRPSGADTELGKIIEGWGDYMLYAFAGLDGRLAAWLLGDLHVFRRWHARQLVSLPAGGTPGLRVPNRDGTWFTAFTLADLPSEFIVARAHAPLTPRVFSGALA